MSNCICIFIIGFALGVAFNKWDSVHGREVGLRHGKYLRSIVMKEPKHDQ